MVSKSRRGRVLGYSLFTGRRLESWQLVAETALGRPLPVGAVVHHVDRNKQNNSPDNLVICPSEAYHNLIHLRQDALDNGHPVHYRKCPYCKEYDNPENMMNIQVTVDRPSGTCIHRECRIKYLREHRATTRRHRVIKDSPP